MPRLRIKDRSAALVRQRWIRRILDFEMPADRSKTSTPPISVNEDSGSAIQQAREEVIHNQLEVNMAAANNDVFSRIRINEAEAQRQRLRKTPKSEITFFR